MLASKAASGLTMSLSARPDWPFAFDAGGAIWKMSQTVSWLAGMTTMVLSGMTIVWPLTVIVPPITGHVAPACAAFVKYSMYPLTMKGVIGAVEATLFVPAR